MLRKIKVSTISPETKKVYDIFSKKPYADNIATLVSLEALFRILKKEKPKKILEIGGGIGTLSYLILENTNAHLDIIEDLDFCIKELSNNLLEFRGRYNLIENYDADLFSGDYDLIIVDGGTEEFLQHLINALDSVGVIYIDGNRQNQRRILRKGLSKQHIFRVKKYVDVLRKVKGGFQITCHKSKNPLVRLIYFWYWEAFCYLSVKLRNGLRRILGNKFLRDYSK